VAGMRGFRAVSLDVDDGETAVIGFYRGLGSRVVAPHRHHWRSVDPATGRVTAEGVGDTVIMRYELAHRGGAGEGRRGS
jgi:ribosomal protein S18 acetylase RimI-like enzyme